VVEGSGAIWFGACGFDVLSVVDDGVELVVEIESTPVTVGCPSCGTRARPKDRRWVTVRDAPTADRAVRLRWRKRVWCCPEPDCGTRTWTERGPAEPRRVLTTRAEEWATDRVAAVEGTPASIARTFGVSWSTVWSAVGRVGRTRVGDAPVGPSEKVGFDETVMQPARRRRRRRFVTAAVDVDSGGILDVFEGRDAGDLRAWTARMPPAWPSTVEVVSLDPHEGYRSAVVNPDPLTGLPSPLYGVRRLLLLGAERVDERGWARIHAALDAGDPHDEVRDCWVAKEKVRDVYLTDDPNLAAELLDDAIAWCTAAESGPELRRLAKTLRRWRAEILAHHTTGASNGPVEAANLLIKQVKRSGRGFRNFGNYRLRILLADGMRRCQTSSVTSIRTRRPRFVA